ncbi:hypothetical protein GCM10009677_48450 [Sphaerisporangium rubeum]|uniref:Uncharacterized protein n=1 Tax=Sphaerisporangium rubeum TaxID=321317 RepID=A0A7X0I941_9ACTN|nr:hypothetical protein [Sphaerisporangium rubeum]MBB6470881.1 hypothetical protein [Sphaerisporangium rubeum]
MRHPTDGTLRRLLDEPAGVADADRAHVTGCAACLSGLATARQDALAARAALDVEFAERTDADADVDAAWRRLSHAVAAEERGAASSASARRWRALLRSPVVAVFGVVVLLTGAGAAAAGDWLQIFRAKQIAPVRAPEAELVQVPDLSAFGRLDVTEKMNVRKVAGPDAARQAAGLSVPRVGSLPRGVTGEPTYHVLGRMSAVFTFSAATTARTAAAAGKAIPPAPAGLDGSQFRLVAGPGLAAVWSRGRPVPALIVGRAVAPVAYSSGVPFAAARDYLLSLGLMPESVASQLRAFGGDAATLPVFTSIDEVTTSTADVGGTPATVIATRDGSVAAVVWVRDGAVTAVAGSLSTGEALSVARGLRWDR